MIEIDALANQLISAAVGIFSGFITGFFFERRQTRVARHEALRLEAENRRLRELVETLDQRVQRVQTNVTTAIGPTPMRVTDGQLSTRADIAEQILAYVTRRMDAKGEVDVTVLFEHFYARYGAAAADEGLRALEALGRIQRDKRVVRFLS